MIQDREKNRNPRLAGGPCPPLHGGHLPSERTAGKARRLNGDPSSPRNRSGFTLIELLVVIGIILILLGLLFPAISAVRRQAAASATKQEMSRLQSAIQAYYGDFRAYPGPFSENQVFPQGTYNGQQIPATPPYYPGPLANGSVGLQLASGSSGNFTIPDGVTSSENLFVGLEGTITVPPNPTPVFWYTPPSNGPTGPSNLGTPGTHASYMAYSSVESTYDGSTDANAGLASNANDGTIWANPAATDSSIPEFVDHFSPARPILYMRARVGIVCSTTANTMLNPINGSNTSSGAGYQYDENQLRPYGWSGTYAAGNTTQMGVSNTDFLPPTPPSGGFIYTSDDAYFANPSQWGVPIGKDGYILISAGPDGIYGTKDDIVIPG